MELMKNNIHMNRQKGTAVSRLPLTTILLSLIRWTTYLPYCWETEIFRLSPPEPRETGWLIRGKLSFAVLYRRESGGLQSLKGEIPFEETVNVPELEEKDSFQVSWNLEDLNTGMINSRKLNIKRW